MSSARCMGVHDTHRQRGFCFMFGQLKDMLNRPDRGQIRRMLGDTSVRAVLEVVGRSRDITLGDGLTDRYGAMKALVGTVFGDHALALALSPPVRRQTIFCLLSLLEASGRLLLIGNDRERRLDLLAMLLTLSEDQLFRRLATARPPAGLLPALEALGHEAKTPEFYCQLYGLLRPANPLSRALNRALSEGRLFSDAHLLVLARMRAGSHGEAAIRAAEKFADPAAYDDFIAQLAELTAFDGLSEQVLNQLAKGRSPKEILDQLMREIAFPPAFLNAPQIGLSYLSNRFELAQSPFCRKVFADSCVSGSAQFYHWRPSAGVEVFFRLSREEDDRWRLDQIMTAGGLAPHGLRTRLENLVAAAGVMVASNMRRISAAESVCA